VRQKRERGAENPRLELWVIRPPERGPERKIDEESPRRPDLFRDLPEDRDGGRGDTSSLELSRDQTNGLVADRSERNEKRHVHAVGG